MPMAYRAALLAASGALLLAQSPTFHATTRLIQVSVIVTDHKGEPVTGLTQDQFAVFDQGKRQEIVFFSEQTSRLRSVQANTGKQTAPSANLKVFSNRVVEGAAAAGSVTSILFDSLNTDLLDTGFARARVEKFVNGIQPQDRVALYGLSTKLSVLHDFTGDADALEQALNAFKATENFETRAAKFKESNLGDPTVDAMENDTNQRSSDLFMGGRVQTTAAALEAIAKRLAGMPGRKSLIWVSGSFPISVGYFQKRLPGARPVKEAFSAEVEAAARALSGANVAIYPVDAHALTTLAGDFNAVTAHRMSAGPIIANRPPERAPVGDLGTMHTLAEATGGRVFENTNDIEGAMRQVMDDSRSTYTVGYYPDHDKWDGKFREIKVRVQRSGVEVRSRSGYLAVADAPPAGPMGVAQVIAQPLEGSELGLSVEMEPAGPRQFKAHVSVDTSGMRFEQKDGRWTGALEVLWVQVGADGRAVGSNQHKLDFRLSPETYRNAVRDGLKISSMETIDEKAVEVRFAARDPETGAAGSLHIPVRGL